MRKKRRLQDQYRFAEFRPDPMVRGIFGDPKARIVRLVRRRKKQHAGPAGEWRGVFTTTRCGGSAPRWVAVGGFE